MRALVIAPQPFFSPRGTPLSVYYRSLITAQLGVEIDLLTYGEGADVDIPGVRIIRIPRFRFLGSVKIGPSFLKLFLDQFMALWTISLLLRRRYDFVHAHEEAVFWCRFLNPFFRFKLVYDMHSSLPQQLTNFKFTTSPIITGAFEHLERTCLRNAEAVITICPELEAYALACGVPPERHFLIENSIFEDVKLCQTGSSRTGASDSPPAVDLAALPGPLVVYAGTFETYQGLDILVSAFAKVVQKLPSAHLVLVGGAPIQVETLKQFVATEGLKGHCTLTGQVSKSQAMKYAECADVLVSPRREGTNTPLKVYEQLASGKPLVATRIRSHTQILSDDVCFLVDAESKSMAEGILAALQDEARRSHVVAGALELYARRYSRVAYEAKMNHLLDVLRDGRPDRFENEKHLQKAV